MLTDFLIDVEVLTVPEVKVWVESEAEEGEGHWEVSVAAQYKTQTILNTRPETKAQSDLDRVIGLGKPKSVVDKFIALVNSGLAWDWCEAYITYLNELDTWSKWEVVQEFDEEGEPLPLPVKPDAPIEPVRKVDVINTYARTIFKAEREAKLKALKVKVDLMVFDADETSQTRMIGAVTSMDDVETQLWVLANNEPVLVTKVQLLEALQKARIAQTAMWTA